MFFALSDPTRRALVERLAAGEPDTELTVGELAAPFDVSLAAISKHLNVLEGAGLLERRREGRVCHCRLRGEALATASAWLEHHRAFWNARLDALADLLNEETDNG